MKKLPRVALAGAGSLRGSPLSFLKSLGDCLGPVTASSLRVASRLANGLRAGYPVVGYEEFAECEIVLISVPDASLSKVISEMVASGVAWDRKIVVLCSDRLGCRELGDLVQAGATPASLMVAPGFDEKWWIVECQKSIERQIRFLFAGKNTRITNLMPCQKANYLVAIRAFGDQFATALTAAADGLEIAGLSKPEAALLLDKHATRGLRSYFRSGRAGG